MSSNQLTPPSPPPPGNRLQRHTGSKVTGVWVSMSVKFHNTGQPNSYEKVEIIEFEVHLWHKQGREILKWGETHLLKISPSEVNFIHPHLLSVLNLISAPVGANPCSHLRKDLLSNHACYVTCFLSTRSHHTCLMVHWPAERNYLVNISRDAFRRWLRDSFTSSLISNDFPSFQMNWLYF